MGVDLLDFYRGKISVRRLCVFVRELDQNSRVMTELRHRGSGHDDPLWEQQQYQLADIFDILNHLVYFTQVNLWGKGVFKEQPTIPVPYPRPGQKPPPPPPTKFTSSADLSAMFGPGAS